jgi:hypothetical protein
MLTLAICISVSNASAWDDEGGLDADETYSIMYNSWYGYHDTNPKWYDPIADPIKEYLVKFEAYFTHTPPDTEVIIMIKKWSYRDGSYHETDIYWQDARSLSWHENTTEIPLVNPNPVEEFFKNNTAEFDNFTTVDEDFEHPDILNISVTVDTDGTLYDMTKSGYYTIDDDSLNELERQITDPDYGFALDGRGSGGSSGSIYEGINMYGYGPGDESGMGKGFGWIFFGLIPIIFIFAVFKFCRRCLWGEN